MSDFMAYSADMQYPNLKLPKAAVHSSHPFLHRENHQKLLQYLQSRLRIGAEARDRDIGRMVAVDKNVAGWMTLSEEDRKREQEHSRSGKPQALLMNLPLSYVHLDDIMTYYAQTFAPTRGMFYHTGKPEEVGPAAQIVTIMNNHAIYGGYYREVLLGIFSCLKYNKGGFFVNWSQEQGPKIGSDEQGKITAETQLRWEGNRVEAIDNYNFLFDPSVPTHKLHCDGEFVAQAKIRSYYWLQKAASEGQYFNCTTALNNIQDSVASKYYRSPPKEAQFDTDSNSGTDWVSLLSAAQSSGVTNGFELVDIYIRLNPVDFGLIAGNKEQRDARTRYEVWKFTVLNDSYVIEAQYQNNIHGYLPCTVGVINDDLMGSTQKSVAEILTPLQDFASFLMNTHVLGTRKALWNTTIYDPTMVDMGKIPPGEVAAQVACEPAAYGKDVRTYVWQPENKQETRQTMTDLESVMGLINQFFPTQSLPSQIASIDRAVTNQVAAVQQGANRRQQKSARLMDDMIFRNIRHMMYYNILQYQGESQPVTDYYTGKQVEVDLTALRGTDMPFIIGQGLKSLDRQAAAEMLQQIIFALIQAPQAAADFNLADLIDYWTSMIDIDVDMKQFRKSMQQKQDEAAAAAGAAPGGNPINPATNPGAVTAPIYG